MTSDHCRLVLLESLQDVEILNEAGLLRGDDVIRLCLAPGPAVELERHGLDYRFPHQFLPSIGIQEELDANWERLDKLIATIDECVLYGRAAAYYLRVLLDTCMEKVTLLCATLAALAPKEVVYVRTRSAKFDFRLIFSESESLYAQLLPLIHAAHFPDIDLASLPPASRVRNRRPALSIPGLKHAMAPSYHAVRFRLTGIFRRRPSAPSLCVAESGHGLARAAFRLSGRYRVYHWVPRNAFSLPPDAGWTAPAMLLKNALSLRRWRRHCRDAWEDWRGNAEVRTLFVHRDVDFFDVVRPRLRYLFTKVIPHLYVLDDTSRGFFTRRQVKCLASNFFSRPSTYVLALGARATGVRVVTAQHSAYGYWDWRLLKYVDAVMSDYKFVGGEGVARYMENVERAGCKPVITGLPSFDDFVGTERAGGERQDGRPRVVYALASYVKNFIHYTHSRMTLTEYFEVNRRVLEVLGSHPEVDVRVRPHPSELFEEHVVALEQWLRTRNWSHVRFEGSGTTVQAMQKADLIIIDSPSTVLLHAATTRARLLVFNQSLAITEEGLNVIRRRATYEDDLDKFLNVVGEVLNGRDFSNNNWNDETLLRMYATYLHDGQSLIRTEQALEQILNLDISLGNAVPV